MRTRAGRRCRTTVVAYIVRRLLAAVGLLFIVSVITFAIFYLGILPTRVLDLAAKSVGTIF